MLDGRVFPHDFLDFKALIQYYMHICTMAGFSMTTSLRFNRRERPCVNEAHSRSSRPKPLKERWPSGKSGNKM